MKILLFLLLVILIFRLLRAWVEIIIKLDKLILNFVLFNVIKIKIFEKNIKEKPKNSTKGFKKEDLYKYLKLITRIIDILNDERSKISMEVYLQLIFGFSEPDKTGILYGLLNSLVYSLDIYFKNYFKEFTSEYHLVPKFHEKHFNFEFKLIIKLKNYLIIYYLFKLIYSYKYKRKGEYAYGTSN